MGFMEHNKLAIATQWENIFARSVLNAWKDVFLDLVQRLPKTESEFCRQPLIWNFVIDTLTRWSVGG